MKYIIFRQTNGSVSLSATINSDVFLHSLPLYSQFERKNRPKPNKKTPPPIDYTPLLGLSSAKCFLVFYSACRATSGTSRPCASGYPSGHPSPIPSISIAVPHARSLPRSLCSGPTKRRSPAIAGCVEGRIGFQ